MKSVKNLFFALLRRLLMMWVRTRVNGGSRRALALNPDQPVCYVLQATSLGKLLVLDHECREAGLPLPRDVLEHESLSLADSYFYLIPRRNLMDTSAARARAPDALKTIVAAMAEDSALDVQVVPVSIFWGRSPDKERSLLKIMLSDTWAVGGRIQQFLKILILGRQTFVQFSKPMTLRQVMDPELDQAETVRKLVRVLRLHFRNMRAGILGPDLSHRRTLVNSLLDSPLVKNAVQLEAEAKKQDLRKVQVRARKYADEIASDLSYAVIRVYDLVLTWLWNQLYNGVRIHNLETVKEIAGEHELIYVPCHRSHIDYLLMSYVLYHEGLQLPHIAAGINLNMPVLGPILRRGGAFFMRRSFKDNQLYATVFSEYLHATFIRGYSMEYFVEGGRSRTGRMLQPRPGMLSMTVRSFLRDSKKPIVFVPVYVGYEKILEERTYLGELRGKKKKKESPLDVIRTLRNMKSQFGRVYVNFGEPIHLREFLTEMQPDWQEQHYGEEYKPWWLGESVSVLANRVVTRINNSVAVNAINLVATALLSTSKQAMDEKILIQQVDLYQRLIRNSGYSKTMTVVTEDPRNLVAYVEELGLISRMGHELGDILFLEGNNAVLMTYYRNNIIHLLAIPALIASMFRHNAEVDPSRIQQACRNIYPYLKSELFLHWSDEELPDAVNRWIDALVNAGLLLRDGELLTRPDTSGQCFYMLDVLGDAIRQTLERFYIVIVVLQRAGNREVTAQELESRCQLIAQRMSVLHGFNAPEFFDKSLFRNFIATLQEMKVLSTCEDDKLLYQQPVELAVADASLVLSDAVRQTIRQVSSIELCGPGTKAG